jgi:hypothetical protein
MYINTDDFMSDEMIADEQYYIRDFVIQAGIGFCFLVILVQSVCFKSKEEDDDEEKVESFQISPWSCLCNIFRSPESLSPEPDDFRFTTCSVQSMDISLPEDNTGKCYLPTGVDGCGTATKKFLDSKGSISKLDQKERQKLQDSRVIMKAYLISKLVAARYTFEDGQMEFNERAESNHIDMMEYKERTQNMYDLLYAGQITVDTRATKRQQRIALKRLKKSNLNLRPSKIRELAKQMKKEAENQADTISSGIESGQTETDSYDLSKAESNDTEIKVGQSSAMTRLMLRLGLKGGSHDSAVGMSSRSSIASFEGPSSREQIPHVTIAGGGPTTRRVHNYGGAQF